ncbi:exodeoxyribonuclease VII large subunit, partial [Devosia sp.]|uniref:exodeoxyribonuclease VII large subunit n=1 Tax=Devosia sp. TaxID=1871048 RepID=UPI002EE9E7F9
KALRGELRHCREALAPLATRLAPAWTRLLGQRRDRLGALGRLLESYGYRNVLQRGYALVTDEAGGIVRSPAQLRPGEGLTIEVADGRIGATVSGAPGLRRKPRPDGGGDDQESLF